MVLAKLALSSDMTLYKDHIPKFAVAPMMDWTDKHCRFLHRQLSQHALLYTEMVVADAIIHGDQQRLLGYDDSEHPIAVQLGGSDPEKLKIAAKVCEEFGYDEINLNVGCPSDRVQSGTFGACLMREPELVASCVDAMKSVVGIPVTVKCRIGVDEQDEELALDELTSHVRGAGVDALWVHARKAWLDGLSPKENRDIPPLNYERVYRLKDKNADLFVGINGGIADLDTATAQMNYVDGVMLGRAAYHNSSLLADVDHLVYGLKPSQVDWIKVCDAMIDHAKKHMEQGGRLIHITRHMVGLFHGLPGARRYRQILSTDAVKNDASPDIIRKALAEVRLPLFESA